MKTICLLGLALSLNAYANIQYAPNDGTARPGNPGTASMDSSNIDPNLEKVNTSPNPIPDDTTLQGKTQTGPYKTPGNKQSQESSEEELDYRAIPQVDHSDGEDEATENQ